MRSTVPSGTAASAPTFPVDVNDGPSLRRSQPPSAVDHEDRRPHREPATVTRRHGVGTGAGPGPQESADDVGGQEPDLELAALEHEAGRRCRTGSTPDRVGRGHQPHDGAATFRLASRHNAT